MNRTKWNRPVFSGNVLLDTGLYMCAFGLFVGLIFPYFATALGVEHATAFHPRFVLSSAAAGIAVGVVGTVIVRRTVGAPLRRVASSMATVRDHLEASSATGEPAAYDRDELLIELDSSDELGDCARSFNALVEVLAKAHDLDEQIRRLSVGLSEHLESGPLVEVLLSELVEHGPFDAGAVLVVRRDGVALVGSSGISTPGTLADHPLVLETLDRGRNRRIEFVDDLRIDASLVTFRPRSVDLLVLNSHGVPFGLLVLAAATDVGRSAGRLADVAAAALSLSLRNALTHEEVEQLAAIDALTGVYNRRLGLQRLAEEYARATRANGLLAAILYDIDHFKQVNDTHGHLAGDQVLRAVADAARGIIREGDSLVRLGGEEFLALLPGASVADALELAERLRRVISEVVVPHGPAMIQVTVSLGVAALPDARVSESAHLIARADDAMYAAKRAGRNRVVHARPEVTAAPAAV